MNKFREINEEILKNKFNKAAMEKFEKNFCIFY